MKKSDKEVIQTVRGWIEKARAAGHDALGLANDPEAIEALDKIRKERTMPISPSQVRSLMSNSLNNAIKQIDQFLKTCAVDNFRDEWWFNVSNLPGGTDPAEVIKAYANVGWDVRMECDSRDGDAIVFKAPK